MRHGRPSLDDLRGAVSDRECMSGMIIKKKVVDFETVNPNTVVNIHMYTSNSRLSLNIN